MDKIKKMLGTKLFQNGMWLFILQIFNTVVPLLTLPYITVKVDYWDIDAMADAMYALCMYPSLHEYLQVEGKKEVDGITWEKVGQRIRKLYDETIQKYK